MTGNGPKNLMFLSLKMIIKLAYLHLVEILLFEPILAQLVGENRHACVHQNLKYLCTSEPEILVYIRT
jgi:hypothetical protein